MRQIALSESVGSTGVFTDGDWVETKDQDPNGEVRLIQLADIGVGAFLDKSSRFLTMEAAKRLRCTFLEPGDLLIARMPDPIGRTCIFPGLSQPCATVVDVCVLRPDPRIVYASYANWMINSPQFLTKIDGFVSGSTRQRISRGNLSTLSIPLPPLDEQKRIAAILDQADELRRKRQRAIDRLNQLGQAIFYEMFGDPVSNPFGWPVKKLGEIGVLDRGISKHRPRNDPALLGGAHPLIQTGDVANADGYIRSFISTYSDLGLKQSKKWPTGTLCITIAANIGKTAILEIEACFPDSVVGFTPSKETNAEYVQFWMSCIQKRLEEVAPQSAQKNINLAILRELPIPMPPRQSQDEFGTAIREIELHKASLWQSANSIGSLFAAVQHRAFQGEL